MFDLLVFGVYSEGAMMLVLSRKPSVKVGAPEATIILQRGTERIEVQIIDASIRGYPVEVGRLRVGVTAPMDWTIIRGELEPEWCEGRR